MNDGLFSRLLLLLALLGLQALITLAHATLMNARMGALRDAADNGNARATRLLGLMGSTNTTFTYYTASTIIKFAMASIVVLSITSSSVLPYILALFVLACVVIVLGDTVPEAIGSTHADVLLVSAGTLMSVLVWLFTPLVGLLVRISRVLSTIFRSNTSVNTVTEEEIMTMIDAGHTGGSIEEEEKDMLYSVLQLGETHISEMMIPRIDITAVALNHSIDQAAEVFITSGFSRIPVYEENLDNIRGLLYAKDLLARWHNSDEDTTIEILMRAAYFVPETKPADELLKELQQRKVHLAIVVDDYGGTAGLVTIEDIIEEIIGDIQDEYDINEEDDYEQTSEHEYIVDAGIDIDDFNDLLDLDLPTDDSDTLGGYIYTVFGRVPEVDEEIEEDKFYLRVMSVDGRRIRKVYARRKIDTNDTESAEPDIIVPNNSPVDE